MTLFSSVGPAGGGGGGGGGAAWGLTRGSAYVDWYGIGAPSLLTCLERLATLQSTGDSRLEKERESTFIKRRPWGAYWSQSMFVQINMPHAV